MKKEEKMEMIRYHAALVIRNLDQLPRGTGAPYLEVIRAHNGELVAVAWRRRPVLEPGRKFVSFR